VLTRILLLETNQDISDFFCSPMALAEGATADNLKFKRIQALRRGGWCAGVAVAAHGQVHVVRSNL
jgi:hypothetical protein